jgi:hypothetical protein
LERRNLSNDKQGNDFHITTNEIQLTHTMKPMQKADMRFLKVTAEYRMTDRKHGSY